MDYSVTTSLQEEKKKKKLILNKKFDLNNKKIFLLLNEDIVMPLNIKKKFYNYLSTYMPHSTLRKKKG